jgi:hypothetical protein
MQWEYFVTGYASQYALGNEHALNEQLNETGRDGWELAAIDGGRWIFKRPLPAEPPRLGPRPLKSALGE